MKNYVDAPRILREFLSYHETIKGQSSRTIHEYYLDLRMFLRFVKLIKLEMPYSTDLETISIKDVDLAFIKNISVTDVYDFLSYLSNDRVVNENTRAESVGLEPVSRSRKLSAIKSFYKYLTVRTKLLDENPVKDLEYPKLRRSLPKYLTLEQSSKLLESVRGANETRDFAILMIFLNCGVRISELVGLNLSDVYDDRLRIVGKGNKERFVYMGSTCKSAIDAYIQGVRSKIEGIDDNPSLFISRDKNRMSTSAVHRLVKKHLAAAGIDSTQYSAHKLRHTAATLMLSGGVDVKTVQEVLGHEHLNTTEIYTHIENTELKIAAEANPISRLRVRRDDEFDL